MVYNENLSACVSVANLTDSFFFPRQNVKIPSKHFVVILFVILINYYNRNENPYVQDPRDDDVLCNYSRGTNKCRVRKLHLYNLQFFNVYYLRPSIAAVHETDI